MAGEEGDAKGGGEAEVVGAGGEGDADDGVEAGVDGGEEEEKEEVEEGDDAEVDWDTHRSSRGTPPAAWIRAEFSGSMARFPKTRAALFWIDR